MVSVVNGYLCFNCADVALAKKDINPAKPQDNPASPAYDPTQPHGPAVTLGGALAGSSISPASALPTPPTTGGQLDISA